MQSAQPLLVETEGRVVIDRRTILCWSHGIYENEKIEMKTWKWSESHEREEKGLKRAVERAEHVLLLFNH